MVNLTEKDKIEHFKRECKSMKYYRGMLQETKDKLEEISTRLEGVSSPAFKEVVLENVGKGCNYDSKILALMLEEDTLCKELELWEAQIRYVEELLRKIKNPTDKQLIIELLVDRTMTYRDAAKIYNYSLSSMHRRVNLIIKRVIYKK